ncbi:MAG: T9SS C-terminal target domain-containing protein [Ignavibacteriae bacterium]|nr:MAG: T9SS C-terminal target domain-containing protein [Ignavibacteriota bacterium]
MKISLSVVVALFCVSAFVTAQERLELQGGSVLDVRTLSTSLPHPTSLAIDADGFLWSTDKNSGSIWRMNAGGWSTIVGTVPGFAFDVEPRLDAQNGDHIVIVSYTTPEDHLVVARYGFDGAAIHDADVILDVANVPANNGHSMTSLADGTLLISVGSFDVSDPADMHNLNGKVIRITTDGSAPMDNPFYNSALPADAPSNFIYTLGHRQLAGFTQLPADHASLPGTIYAVEPGAYSFDEINRLEAGHHYGEKFTAGFCVAPSDVRFDCPKATFNHVPSSVAFYDHVAIPEWKNSLLVGTLRQHGLIVAQLSPDGGVANIDPQMPSDDVLTLVDDQIIGFTSSLGSERIRSVAVDADGRVYLAMNSQFEGEIIGRIVVIENPAIHTPTSVNEDVSTSTSFAYGPNPASDVVHLTLAAVPTSSWSVRIVDLMGSTIITRDCAPATTSVSLPLSGIAAGSYMLVVTTETGSATAPIIH